MKFILIKLNGIWANLEHSLEIWRYTSEKMLV